MVMQEEFELEASLGYIVSSRQPLWANRILSFFFLKKVQLSEMSQCDRSNPDHVSHNLLNITIIIVIIMKVKLKDF